MSRCLVLGYYSNHRLPERFKALFRSPYGPHHIEFWTFRPLTYRHVSSRCTRNLTAHLVLMFTKPKLFNHIPGKVQTGFAHPKPLRDITAR